LGFLGGWPNPIQQDQQQKKLTYPGQKIWPGLITTNL